jgi:hypothetical protein
VALNVESLALAGDVVELTVVARGGATKITAPELWIEGVPAHVTTRVDGKDLVLVGSVPKERKRPRSARLAFKEGKAARTENLALKGPGLVDMVFGPGDEW